MNPTETSNDNENKIEIIKKSYAALFVSDVEILKSIFPPKHLKVLAHHSTIELNLYNLSKIETGKSYKIKILGRAFDEKGDVLLVENPKSKNKFPHITLSCAEGVSSSYSNTLLQKAFIEKTIIYLNNLVEIDVVEGYFDGEKYFIIKTD